jgi:hypothetical protein
MKNSEDRRGLGELQIQYFPLLLEQRIGGTSVRTRAEQMSGFGDGKASSERRGWAQSGSPQ